MALDWQPVEAAFRSCFADLGEEAAACAVTWDGELVVDVWGGDGWERDTMAVVMSATKGLTTLCALMLADRGQLDLDAPVSAYWPEFGKPEVTVRQVMSHRAGLPHVVGEDALASLESQQPEWEPGTAQGYHSASMGWIVGELVRRVDGRTIGTFLRDEVGIPDLHIGLPESEERRVRPFVPFPPALREVLRGMRERGGVNLAELDIRCNSREFHAGEFPFANGICTARALALAYAAVPRLVGPRTLADALRRQTRPGEVDRVVGYERVYGTGFLLTPSLQGATGAGAFGHDGAGGSLALADGRLTFAYVTAKMDFTDPYARARRVLEASISVGPPS